jgi:hypothetical protein
MSGDGVTSACSVVGLPRVLTRLPFLLSHRCTDASIALPSPRPGRTLSMSGTLGSPVAYGLEIGIPVDVQSSVGHIMDMRANFRGVICPASARHPVASYVAWVVQRPEFFAGVVATLTRFLRRVRHGGVVLFLPSAAKAQQLQDFIVRNPRLTAALTAEMNGAIYFESRGATAQQDFQAALWTPAAGRCSWGTTMASCRRVSILSGSTPPWWLCLVFLTFPRLAAPF